MGARRMDTRIIREVGRHLMQYEMLVELGYRWTNRDLALREGVVE